MTAVDEAPKDAPAAAPAERRCPRCGSSLRPDQEWCLSCGAGLGARIASPRGWRWPMAVIGALLALLAIAIVLTLVELAKDSETITPAAATPAPTAAPTAAVPTPTPTASTNPSQIPPSSGGTAATPQTSAWPAGKIGYTVMLDSSSSLAAANARAKDLAGQGITAGVLDTSGYKPVTKDRYVIFSGQYVTPADARNALKGFTNRVTGAHVVRIAPA